MNLRILVIRAKLTQNNFQLLTTVHQDTIPHDLEGSLGGVVQ